MKGDFLVKCSSIICQCGVELPNIVNILNLATERRTSQGSANKMQYFRFLVPQQLFISSCFFCGYVPSSPHSQVHIQTHKPDQTRININGVDMAKSVVQLLYGPRLFGPEQTITSFSLFSCFKGLEQPSITASVPTVSF